MEIPSLDPQCPWYELSEIAKPNVKWCEAPVCSWISEPANTWSNLTFIFMGLFIWYIASNKNQKTAKMFGPLGVFVGVCSFVYHMSYTMFLQVFDFIAMYAFVGLVILLNLRRLNLISQKKQLSVLIMSVIGLTGLFLLFYFTGVPVQLTVALMVLGLLVTEIIARKKEEISPKLKYYYLSIGSLLIALTFTILDVTRVWCNPENHFVQGHALWHVFNSFTIYFLYKYYEQFDLDEAES